MEPLISVIIPIYKVESYLRECVDSVCNQTYRNLEIILVDDGSPDNCGAICDEYAVNDKRIKVIHKVNGGLSDARNVGFAQSHGAYLMFLDSDDLLPKDAIDYLYKIITESNAQLAIGGRERFDDETGNVLDTDFHGEENTVIHDRVGAMRQSLQQGCAAWARLYRREMHDGILFPVGEINEDEAIVMQILERCSKVILSNRIVYSYRCRPESITTTRFSVKKMVWQKHCADNLAFVRENHPELEADAAARYRNSLLWSLTEIAMSEQDFTPQVRELVAALKENRKLFRSVPFRYPQDKIRLWVLTNLRFGWYKMLIRRKRGV